MYKEKKKFSEILLVIFMAGILLFVIIAIIGSAIFATQNFTDNEQNINYQSQQNYDPDQHLIPITFNNNLSNNKKIGLALGGGAAKGLAHIGVLKALDEANIQIDFVAGSSMGALIGAAYVAGIPIDSIEQIALKIEKGDIIKLIDPTIPTSGFINGKKIEDFLLTHLGNKKIEDTQIPFSVTAADILTGKQYIINKGDLVKAVRTSISIPAVFDPQKYHDITLVDGGLIDPIPMNAVMEMGAEFIIAVNVLVPPDISHEATEISFINGDSIKSEINGPFSFFQTSGDTNNPNIIQIIQKTVMISQAKIAQFQIDLYKPDLLIEPDTRNINSWDFLKAERAIELGYKATIKALTEYNRKVNNE
jgi:NTE family protein